MNKNIVIYIDEFPGEKAWGKFFSRYSKRYDLEPVAQIKTVLTEKGLNAKRWMESSPPALYGHTPFELLKEGEDGIIALKTLLMRMPL